MSTREEIITGNLRRLIEATGLGLTELAHEAWPELSQSAGRKRLERALGHGWIEREHVDRLIELWDIDLAEFYLPLDPPLDVAHMKRMRLKRAVSALRKARTAFMDALKLEFGIIKSEVL